MLNFNQKIIREFSFICKNCNKKFQDKYVKKEYFVVLNVELRGALQRKAKNLNIEHIMTKFVNNVKINSKV